MRFHFPEVNKPFLCLCVLHGATTSLEPASPDEAEMEMSHQHDQLDDAEQRGGCHLTLIRRARRTEWRCWTPETQTERKSAEHSSNRHRAA